MTDVAAILNAHPRTSPGIDEDVLVIAVQECLNCAQSCTSCADACIADPSAAHLGRSVGAALNCADMATAAVRVLSCWARSDEPAAHEGARRACAGCQYRTREVDKRSEAKHDRYLEPHTSAVGRGRPVQHHRHGCPCC